MKKIAYIIIAAAAIAAASCAKEAPVAPQSKVILTATLENSKTILTEENTVEWVAGDKVSVFEGSTNVQATALQGGASTSLEGEITTSGPWYALYPYNADATISEGIITTTLPANQKAVPGTFADGLNISVAYSETSTLAFKNVLSYVKFTVSNDLVRKVTITGAADEALAGTIAIDYNAGQPTYSVVEGSKSIVLEPEGEYFEKDAVYYAAILPQTLPSGFNITYNDAFNEDHVATSTNAPVFKRSVTLNIGSPDSEFQIDGPITFADPDVKADIVKAFDKNGDGELSKSEAAAVTFDQFNAYSGEVVNSKYANPSAIWTDPLNVDTFDEFKYFIGLQRTDGNFRTPVLFPGCTNLTSATLPYNTNQIANYCFYKCSSLETIVLPSNVKAIYTRAFEGCTSLNGSQTVEGQTSTFLIFPKSLTQLSSYAFKDCTSLVKIENVDNVIETIGADVFEDCTNLSFRSRNFLKLKSLGKGAFKNTKVSNLSLTASGLTEIPDSAFFGCASLVTVKCCNKIKTIGKHAFNGCKKLTTFSINSTDNKKIEFPVTLTSIGDYTCSNCPLLGQADGLLVLPDGVTTLGVRCFRYCKSIKNVTFPSTLTKVGSGIFTGSGSNPVSIECITCNAVTPPTMTVVSNVYRLGENEYTVITAIKVPFASLDNYKTAQGWSNNASVISAIE